MMGESTKIGGGAKYVTRIYVYEKIIILYGVIVKVGRGAIVPSAPHILRTWNFNGTAVYISLSNIYIVVN